MLHEHFVQGIQPEFPLPTEVMFTKESPQAFSSNQTITDKL